MLDRLVHLPADVWHWLADHKLAAGAVALCLAVGGGVAAYFLTRDEGEEVEGAPAPTVLVREVPAPDEPDQLGFPDFATKNTTRVGGPDPVANAAAVALAVHPSTGGIEGPPAVSVVAADDWVGGVAAASLAEPAVGAPILLAEAGELPELTEKTIEELDPQGSRATAGRQAFVLGEAGTPNDLKALELEGEGAALAAEAARLRERLAGQPEHFVVAGLGNPALAVPAAAWAARSGDPVLFVERDKVPEATRELLSENKNVPVFVLGPGSAVSDRTVAELKKTSRQVRRVGAGDPVANAIEFARFADGAFGWNITDPGHGFVVAAADRPMDAIAAVPLSAAGTWGPLLLSDDPDSLPPPLHGYLLDLKPGYLDDPTRAVYNHVWVIGDDEAISIDAQAQLDELAEAVPVSSGSGAETAPPGPEPGAPESEPDEEDEDRERDQKGDSR